MGIFSEDRMEIYYERGQDYGHSGDPLLFISGTGGDLRNKPNQFDSPLAKVFELIAYDQRGLGQTSKPDGDYTMADYADDAAALLDYLNLDRVPVVGVSFGGMVGQEFVLRHPAGGAHGGAPPGPAVQGPGLAKSDKVVAMRPMASGGKSINTNQ